MLRWIDLIKFSKYGNPEPERRVEKSEEEWQEILLPEQFRVARLKNTERPYSGEYCRNYEPGQYACVCCGSVLFDSSDKYNSLSGWPSFSQPVTRGAIKYEVDYSHGMKRIEAICNICDCHLGHVFPDGPEPSGLRYCINSASIRRLSDSKSYACFGGGCFWCVEALIQELEGVEQVEPGYSGGKGFNPTYREVSSGLTGHAEVVRVKFDPAIISYEELLRTFFEVHDARSIDPAGGSYTQYRSIILYYNDQQKVTAERLVSEISGEGNRAVFTEVAPLKFFYPAEEKHFNYFLKNPEAPYCLTVISPKLERLRKKLKQSAKG